MKTLFYVFVLFLANICFASDGPRIVTLTGAPFPKAEIVRVEAPTGILLFRYLDSAGKPVDSGNSIARFTPVQPTAPVPPSTVPTYSPPSDATLVAAIQAE
jgi:hypothetical protein